MMLPDVNIWLALVLSGHEHHTLARSWFENQVKPKSIHFCRATQLGLLRLLTTKSVTAPYRIPPLSNNEAWQILERLMDDDRVTLASEPNGILTKWKLYARKQVSSPKLWMDAWLAAFATCGGLQCITLDKGFSQFPDLDLNLLTNHSM